jgi:hypothetical protein
MQVKILPSTLVLILATISAIILFGLLLIPQAKAIDNLDHSNTWKIFDAMTAAPHWISANATILDWAPSENNTPITLRTGTNSWTCFPDDPSTPGNDPICADKQAMAWFQAYMNRTTPSISQPGIAYMLKGGNSASNTDPFATKPASGENWVWAPAHIMLFPTGILDKSVYSTDPKNGGPWIMWAGTSYEHLMIPIR